MAELFQQACDSVDRSRELGNDLPLLVQRDSAFRFWAILQREEWNASADSMVRPQWAWLGHGDLTGP